MKNTIRRFLSLVLCMCMVCTMLPNMALTAFAVTDKTGTVTGLADSNIGLTYESDGSDYVSWTANGTTVDGSAISTSGCSTTHHETTLIIANNRSVAAQLSFDYTIAANGGTIQIANENITADGSFSKELSGGESIKVYIKSNSTSSATTIKLTNLSLASNVTATATFQPAENGSYTVDGKSITEEYTNTQSAMTAYKLVATPDSGYQFLGWYDVTHEKYIGTSATASLNVEEDCTITAKFVESSAGIFETGGQVYTDLNQAISYAKENSQSKITLLSNATLTGSYTIPSGITLLIPNDSTNTLYTDTPQAVEVDKGTRTAYRTLTLAEGASITVEGGLSLSGWYKSAAGSAVGYMTGAYGLVQMSESSAITVKNGGAIYAWGYVSGNGTVTVESGGTAMEWYQITDFRGGSATLGMGNKVFPFNQYYIQNIEVPMTLYAGATETAYTGVYASSRINTSAIPFIGDNGMFKIVSGSLTKTYDGSTDRLKFTINGESELNILSLKLAGSTVNSSSYVLPITNNITLDIASGKFTVNQTSALLPGVEVNVAKGAELAVSSGTALYVYDSDEWGGYSGGYSSKFIAVSYAPSKTYSRSDANDIKDVKIDVNGTLTAAGSIYTTESGANICSSEGTGKYIQQTAAGSETTTYQYTQSGSTVTKAEIPITPAKLKNADETYTETSSAEAGTIYKYEDGEWVEAETYTVTFTDDSGTATVAAQTVLAGESITLPDITETRDGYTFAGWTESQDGTGTVLKAGEKYTPEGDTTLYAQWSCQHQNTELKNQKDATCTEEGYTGDRVCTTCGETVEAGMAIDATGHKYGKVTYTWSDDNSTCTASRICSACKAEDTETVDSEAKVTQQADCEKPELTTYTATFTSDAFATQTKENVETKDALGHEYAKEFTVDKEATCTKAGSKSKHCNRCDATTDVTEIPATGHKYGEVTYTWSEDNKTCTATRTCSVCATEDTGTVNSVAKVTQQASCEKPELTAYTATFTSDAFATQTKENVETKDALGHEYAEEFTVDKKATCTEAGSKSKHCSRCDAKIDVTEIPATGHKYGEVTYTWSDDNSACTATRTCSVCKAEDAETVNSVAKVTQQASCEKPELTAYTATFTSDAFATQTKENVETKVALGHEYAEEFTVDKEATCTEAGSKSKHCSRCDAKIDVTEIPATGHKYGEVTYTWSNDNGTCTASRICSACKAEDTETVDSEAKVTQQASCEKPELTTYTATFKNTAFAEQTKSDVKTGEATGHSWDEGVITTAAGCTSDGVKTYTCANCGKTRTEAISATGHTVVAVEAKAATCTEPGYTEGTKCSVCDAIISGLTEISATGHDWDEGKITTEPTCAKTGVKTYTCKNGCGGTKTETVPATDHTPVVKDAKEATVTEDGYTGDTYCSVCGEKLATGTTIPKTGAKIAQGTVTGGELTVPTEATYGGTVTITAKADSGYYLLKQPVVTTESGAAVEVTKVDDGTYTFTMPKENVTISASFIHLFDDVQDPASWYFNPVYWAVDKGITVGTGDNLFSPGMECTRAQIVTFLWNAAGQPEPTTDNNPFTDVSPSAWYYKAVQWAVENKVTAGTSETTFSPDMKCTRAQIVTFLWNYAGKPTATQGVSFTDVSESAWYYTAVQWAVENKITAGTGDNQFSPDAICTRSQAVTFLYNDLYEKI